MVFLLWSCLIFREIGLIIELHICLMVHFMKLWSIISWSLSLLQEIRLVAPCQVIGICCKF
jgi:hypothetical protein